MAVCKQCGAVNDDDKKFCSECGHELNAFDPKAVQHALDTVEKEFEKDMSIGLDKSRLTFICDVCGKVNPIDVPGHRCSRCGKKMPRNTYVKALKSIKNSPNFAEPVVTIPEEPKVEQPAQPVVQQPQVQECPQYVQPSSAQQVYRMTGRQNSPQQNSQIVQPFVIVPYVSQNQPVLQYNPNSVYRYHKFTEEEKRENLENLARIEKAQEEEAKRREEEERLRREAMFANQTPTKKSNVRVCAVFSLLFAAIVAFVLYGMPSIMPDGFAISGNQFLFNFADGTNLVSVIMALIDGTGKFPTATIEIALFVCQCLFALTVLLVIIQSLVRLIKNSARPAGVIIPIVSLLSGLASYGVYACKSGAFDVNALTGIYPQSLVCAVMMVVMPIILIITTASARKSK